MTIEVNGVKLSNRTVDYLATALWAETVSLPELDHPEDVVPLDKYFDLEDFDASALRKAEEDCDAWFDLLEEKGLYDRALLYADDDLIAHDFWLTRNGHGAGYWDGDYGDELGHEITALCGWRTDFGECYIYIGDDGKLYMG